MRRLQSMGVSELIRSLYPRIYPIFDSERDHSLDDPNGEIHENMSQLPSGMRATSSSFEIGGCYLIGRGRRSGSNLSNYLQENCQSMYLWLDRHVEQQRIQEVFGFTRMKLEDLDPQSGILPVLETSLNRHVRSLISLIQHRNVGRFMIPQIVRPGMDGAELEVANLMVEDQSNDTWSFVEFLVFLHKQIQLEVILFEYDHMD